MNKKYSEMNDFDKIILSHQENNDDIAELSNFRNEKWKALDIERTKKLNTKKKEGKKERQAAIKE